jgi:hypothetical protein
VIKKCTKKDGNAKVAWKNESVMTPEATVNELFPLKRRGGAVIGSDKPNDAGPFSITTADAALVALSVRPKISPLTIPLTFPSTLLNEKVNVSVSPWLGVEANASANAAAIKLRNIAFLRPGRPNSENYLHNVLPRFTKVKRQYA